MGNEWNVDMLEKLAIELYVHRLSRQHKDHPTKTGFLCSPATIFETDSPNPTEWGILSLAVKEFNNGNRCRIMLFEYASRKYSIEYVAD